MKKLSVVTLATLALACVTAHAAPYEVYVMTKKPPTDGIIKNSSMIFMLTTKDRCPYSFVHYEQMHLAFVFNPALKNPAPGCWAMTDNPSGVEAMIISRDGTVIPSINLMNLYRVDLLDNGDGRVLGPAMTDEDRQRNNAAYKQQFRQP